MARRVHSRVSSVVLVLAGTTLLSGCAHRESPVVPSPSPSPLSTATPLAPAPLVAPVCPTDPLAVLSGRDGGATLGAVPGSFQVRGLVRCVVTTSDPRGGEPVAATTTREFAPATPAVLAALTAPDDPRPTPPETCGSRAPDKPYLLLTDAAPLDEETQAVRPRVPDDGCGSGRPAILAALAAAAWTRLDSRVVVER